MRNLRQLLRRSGLLVSETRRRRVEKGRRGETTQRRLGSEVLEKRELLAGDILGSSVLAAQHNYWNAYDVNDDRQITARDALGVINYLNQQGEGEQVGSGDVKMFYDVNADNRVSAADALGVINAISRGEEVGELVELLITARDLNDQPIAVDANGEINVEVGQIFDLEISYDDLRVNQPFQPPVELGVFQLFTDIAVSQPNVLVPVLNETQRLIIDSSIITVPSTSVTFTIPEAPPGVVGGSLSYVSPIGAFGTNTLGEVRNALLAFGYTTSQFQLTSLDFGNNDLGFQIHWVGDEFGNVDLPNISVDVNETNPANNIPTQTIEFAPFLADGVTPNSDAVRFNINSFSRTFNPTVANPSGEEFYSNQNRGAYDLATGFDEVGGLGLVPTEGGGIPDLTDDGSFLQPFDAFSLRVFVKAAVTDLVVSVNPGEDAEAMLLYGRDDAVPQDLILAESTDTNSNGVAQVVINASINAPGVLSIDPSTVSVNENAGTVELTVTRTDGSIGAVTVDYATANGTAQAGNDYTAKAGTLSFADGETSKTITVAILDDMAVEGSENFTVTLSNPTGGASLGTAVATVTINDNDVAMPGVLSLSVDAISVDEDAGTVTLTVNRTGGNSGVVAVDFATANGTATAGSDYTATSGTLNFANGETSKTITIDITDDMDIEGSETFTVNLSNPTGGATLGNAATTVTINDNDVAVPGVLAFSVASASVDENAGTVTLTVSRTGGSDGEVTVDFITGDGTATAGQDYVAQMGTLTFADGDTSETITISITDDSEIDPNEVFTVTLSNPGGGASLGQITTATVTIVDDEAPGVLAFSVAAASVNEDAGTVTLTVNRTGGSDGEVTVDFATSNGTAVAGQDYVTQSGTLTFADGVTTADITIQILDDVEIELDETFTVNLSNPTGGATLGAVATATVTILEDDVPGTITFQAAAAQVNEDAGTVTLLVSRINGSDGEVTVDFATSNGTALAGQDYTAQSGTLTFANGVTSQEITIQITDDSLIEADETFTVTLSNAGGGASLGNTTVATVTILEDDIEVAFDASTAVVDEDAGTVTLNVVRIGDSDATVTVDFSTADGTAQAGLDYVGQSDTLTFGPGVTSQTITVAISDDKLDEPDETFTVGLSNPTGGAVVGAVDEATVTIVDDDIPGVLSIQAQATVDEKAGTVLLTVSRANGSDGEITVQYATSNGTAEAGLDYTAKSGTLTFANGQLTQTIEIDITDDVLGSEPTETFNVTLSNPTGGATLGNATAVVSILNVNEGPTVSGPVVVTPRSEQDPSFTVSESELLTNASDREGDALSVSNLTYLSGNASGIVVNADSLSVDTSAYGSLVDGQTVVVQYSYLISDQVNEPISQTVTITINGFNDPPVARDDLGIVTFQGATVNIDVLANDDAGDGEDQSLTISEAVSNDGVVDIKTDGTLDFTPNADFLGNATIEYTIVDAQGKTDTALVFIDVQNFRPSSISGSVFIDEVENLAIDIANGAAPIRNGIKDTDEEGLGGVLIRLVSSAEENATGAAIDISTLTNANGDFTFSDLAPGTYHVIYDASDAVLFVGAGELVRIIPETGDMDIVGVNFPVISLTGSLDILASTYQNRQGGLVSLDADGGQQFVTSLSGFDDVKFVEFALSAERDSALLTILEEDGDVMTARLTLSQFRLFGSAVYFLKGKNELTFLSEAELSQIAGQYPSYRDAIDQVLAEL